MAHTEHATLLDVREKLVPRSRLSSGTFEQQWDAYRLAKMGNTQMRRLWNEFAEADPGLAQLVAEHDGEATAIKLRNQAKVAKAAKKARKAQKAQKAQEGQPPVPEAGGSFRRSMEEEAITQALNDSDPAWREWARMQFRDVSP